MNALRDGTAAIRDLAVAKEGVRQLLCVVSEGSCSINVRDASTGLLMRVLEGHTQPCSTVKVRVQAITVALSRSCLCLVSLSLLLRSFSHSFSGCHFLGSVSIALFLCFLSLSVSLSQCLSQCLSVYLFLSASVIIHTFLP